MFQRLGFNHDCLTRRALSQTIAAAASGCIQELPSCFPCICSSISEKPSTMQLAYSYSVCNTHPMLYNFVLWHSGLHPGCWVGWASDLLPGSIPSPVQGRTFRFLDLLSHTHASSYPLTNFFPFPPPSYAQRVDLTGLTVTAAK